jgi:hypothetical protein
MMIRVTAPGSSESWTPYFRSVIAFVRRVTLRRRSTERASLRELVRDQGASSVLEYLRRDRCPSLFRLAWRLGPDEVSASDVLQAVLLDCATEEDLRSAAYALLVASVNDINRDYIAEDREADTMIARALVAWWHALAPHTAGIHLDHIVNDLLSELDVPPYNLPRKSQTATVRRIFDRHWPRVGELPRRLTSSGRTTSDSALHSVGLL